MFWRYNVIKIMHSTEEESPFYTRGSTFNCCNRFCSNSKTFDAIPQMQKTIYSIFGRRTIDIGLTEGIIMHLIRLFFKTYWNEIFSDAFRLELFYSIRWIIIFLWKFPYANEQCYTIIIFQNKSSDFIE